MWGNKRRKLAEHERLILDARADKERAEDIIKHIDSQEPEVKEIVTRLEKRIKANHFGEALMLAMERRV